MSENSNQQLRKTIGFNAALSTVVGILIGSGVFFKPQAIYSATNGGPGLGLLAWLIGGLITIAAGLTAAEVSASIIKPGGLMVYLEEIYGERIGFLTGWMQLILFVPAIVAALGIIFAQECVSLLGLNNELYVIAIAIGVIVFIVSLNSLGAKFGGAIQTASTICKLLPLAVIIIFGLIKCDSAAPIMTPLVGEGANIISVLSQILIATLFAYDGWINVGALAGEMKDPGKDLPKAIIGGLSLVMAVYVVINLAYLWVLPADQLASVSSPASAVAEHLFGPMGGKFITVGILISLFGALNGYLLTGPRIVYTLGEQKNLPAALGKLSKNGVPANATLAMAVLSCLYALSGQFNLLTDLAIFAVWAFYTLTFIGVIKLRKDQPNLHRPYRVPLYPIVPMIAIACGVFVVVNQLFLSGMTNTMISLGGLVITLLGLPVYSYMNKNKANSEATEKAA